MIWFIFLWRTWYSFLKKREKKKGAGEEKAGWRGWANFRDRRTNPQRENTFIYSIFPGQEHLWDEREAVTTTKMAGLRAHIWSTTGRRDTLWPLGSNMANTPTWQMISQCFSLRLHISATDHNMQGRRFRPTSHFWICPHFRSKECWECCKCKSFTDSSFQHTACYGQS